MTDSSAPHHPLKENPRYHLGCVSFINSKPLIEPLLNRSDVHVHFEVPANLLGWLEQQTHAHCAALLPVVDYFKCQKELVLLPGGCIGCAGPTLTVRIFSPTPPQQITTLYCDTDSHTSVMLAQVILRHRYGVRPHIEPLTSLRSYADNHGAALLLIGDKVVNSAPAEGYPHQLDLGEEWWQLTGLPFVFACWMAPATLPDIELKNLCGVLASSQRQGATMTEFLLDKYTAEKRWPRDLARRYFTEYLRYAWTDQMTAGVKLFYQYLHEDFGFPQRPLNLILPPKV